MTTLRFVLGDQLSRGIAALSDIDVEHDLVLMVEVAAEATYVKHHKQKIVFLFSAMRHFAKALRREGVDVDYVRFDAPGNTGSFAGELARAVERHRPERVVVTFPGEWRVLQDMQQWSQQIGVPVEIREDDRFFASRERFAEWARDRREWRMEFFYREMRRTTDLLMQGDDPTGGRWNLDPENRKALPKQASIPPRLRFEPDATTREVIALVGKHFADHFGDLEPFGWAVTRQDALTALDDFVTHALPRFGDYQDAMARGEPFIFHGLISPYINAGLLSPREVCVAAETAYREGHAPLNAVEGFIRQILGWREYIRGVYWLTMPDFAQTNALQAERPLPWLYWSGETEMNCMAQVIGNTRRNAYSHHIQRLMVTGNFALLAGIAPREVEEWYLVVYADAYDWVELPNVHGMALFADGGKLASKPYAASGAYINRMSNFCKTCRYDVAQKSGPDACPFNYLYWAFLIRNAPLLRDNARMRNIYRALDKWQEGRKATTLAEADAFLDALAYGPGESKAPAPEGDLFSLSPSAGPAR